MTNNAIQQAHCLWLVFPVLCNLCTL